MAIKRYQETVSGISVSSRTVPEFLESKIVELTSQRDALLEYKEGLLEPKRMMSTHDFQRESEAVWLTRLPQRRETCGY